MVPFCPRNSISCKIFQVCKDKIIQDIAGLWDEMFQGYCTNKNVCMSSQMGSNLNTMVIHSK